MRFNGHPIHPALVHLPMGLLMATPVVDGLALWRPEPWWGAMAFFCRAAGVGAGLAAAVVGALDLAGIPERHPAATTVLRHALAMVAALACFGVGLSVQGRPARLVTVGVLGTDAIGFLLLVLGGFQGGELVYRHLVGTSAGPAAGSNRPHDVPASATPSTGVHDGTSR